MAAKSYSKFVCLLVLLGLIVSAGPAAAQTPAQDSSYRIGPNDGLNIFVWKEAELPHDVTVMPDGKITYPLIGEIMAQGQTASELKKAIADKLQSFVTASEVTVIVKESRSQVVYAIGKLTRPGPIALAPGMTVMQALSAAGGFAEWADLKNILIVRKERGKKTHLRFNYKEFTSGENLPQNILLKPGDTIVTQLSTPPDFPGGYPLRIPKGSYEQFASQMQNIPETARRTFLVHEVRKGETLNKISKKYGVSVYELADANNISTKSKLYVGVPLRIPVLVNPNENDYSYNTDITVAQDNGNNTDQEYVSPYLSLSGKDDTTSSEENGVEVSVSTENTDQNESLISESLVDEKETTGTIEAIAPEGYVAVNYHVKKDDSLLGIADMARKFAPPAARLKYPGHPRTGLVVR